MDVSIIILNFKSAYLSRFCIESIIRVSPKVATEVIVVDNASGESLHPIKNALAACPLPSRLIITEKNLGFAAGNNVGIRAAKGKYIFIANPDIVFRPGAIEALVEYLDHNPTVAMVAPALQNPDGTSQGSCFRFPHWYTPIFRRTVVGKLPWGKRHIAKFEMNNVKLHGPTSVDWLLGGCVLVRREAIDHVGMMDERYFLYFEDIDWCTRFHDAGWDVIYFPSVVCIHYYHRSSAHTRGLRSLLSPLTRIHIRSGIKYFSKFRHRKLTSWINA